MKKSLPLQNRLQFSGLFAPKSPIEFLGFAVITFGISQLSAGNPIGIAFGVFFIAVLSIVWWYIDLRRDRSRAKEMVFALTKEKPQPARGLILLLSPYNPGRGDATLANPEVLNPRIKELLQQESPTDADFDTIQLWKSNLVPQIRAIDYHLQEGKLQDVWLITTDSYEGVNGSEGAAKILQKYIETLFGATKLRVHREGYTVREYEYFKLWRLGEQIFRQSGYRNDVLVADITGGNKMMSVAIAMACIQPGRRMQYMDSQRDWQGNPLAKGEMSPVLIDIDPMLYQSNE
jgi:hypothetical protein